MPFIEVKIIEGVLSREQQQALISELTDAVVRVGGEGMRPMTRCAIQEIRSGLWGVAGKPLTTEMASPKREA
ncbi:tautomerase family protein [Hylemonella gracilis]|jgi:4-oxalocrotonate tautomerase|uniref:4-oxalocrotonate tautomerase n=1 Tax=Hylemonella gracilis ATCC 19624 TaxID=887062 RepID=F3KU35_9BURK|nr:tautomerase family protein [Hylemonella gracilis]EGI76718.1 4-oxalocrotonate tautomerase [Hylemonella gracilis ATCC 19624]